jgi:hypothetical protein
MDAVALEISTVRVTFKLLNDGEEAPIGFQYVDCLTLSWMDFFKKHAWLLEVT